MNWFDDLIRSVDPVRAMRRAEARYRLENFDRLRQQQRAYEGGKIGRRTSGWVTSNNSANAEIGPHWARVTSRARDLVRNNGYARKCISSFERNMIRTGIKVKFADQAEQQLWDKFVEECDANQQLDLYGLQRLQVRSWKESGECLVHFRYEPRKSGLTVPLTIRVLEPDYIDSTRNGPEGSDGDFCITGVQFNKLGRRVGYWMFEQHPGEMVITKPSSLQSHFVPASEIAHLYQIDRPGQVRGVSQLASGIMRLRDLDDYQEAELLRKKIEACFVAFVTGNDPEETVGEQKDQKDGSKMRLESLRPGMIQYLQDGAEVTFGNPSASNNSEYTRDELHAIAAAGNVTFEQLTGDLSRVNFSSIRAGLVEFRALVEMEQWLTYIPMGLRPIVRTFREICFASGLTVARNVQVAVEFTPPKLDWVDPLKDVLAVKEEVKAGLKTISEALRERGYDPEKVFAEIAKERALLKEKGIAVDVVLNAILAKPVAEDDALKDAANEKDEEKQAARLLQSVLRISPGLAALVSHTEDQTA